MDFPGDQQQPGDRRPSHRPPQPPYGPAEDQDDHGRSSYDAANGGFTYDSAQSNSPYGSSDRYGSAYGHQEGYGDPYADHDGYGSHEAHEAHEGHGFHDGGGFEPGHYEPTPEDGPYGPEDAEQRSGRSRKPLIIGVAAVAGVIVLGGAALALTSGGDKPKAAPAAPAPTTHSVNPTPTPTETGKGDRLLSRATDPRPLTLNEVFRARRFKSHGRIYLMTTRRSDRSCVRAVHGVRFRSIVTKAHCTQVLRATFTNGKFVGTIGILNLRSQAGARVAQSASHPKDSFIVPLPGSGDTRKLGQGLSLTTAQTNGHYLILSWVEYPSGKKIARSDYSAVTSFVQSTTYGSNLRPALNYRSMEGKPA